MTRKQLIEVVQATMRADQALQAIDALRDYDVLADDEYDYLRTVQIRLARISDRLHLEVRASALLDEGPL